MDKNGIEKQITNDVCEDILNGQSVHRNEFGINSGYSGHQRVIKLHSTEWTNLWLPPIPLSTCQPEWPN